MALLPTGLSKNPITPVVRTFHDCTRNFQRLEGMLRAGDIPTVGGGGYVPTINGLSGAVTLAAGTRISLSTAGNTITIDGTPYTGDEVWIHVAGDLISHIGPSTATTSTVLVEVTAGSSLDITTYNLRTDAKGHVVGRTTIGTTSYTPTPTPPSVYTSDEVWIHEGAGTFSHIGPSSTSVTDAAGSASANDDSVDITFRSISFDAKGHRNGSATGSTITFTPATSSGTNQATVTGVGKNVNKLYVTSGHGTGRATVDAGDWRAEWIVWAGVRVDTSPSQIGTDADDFQGGAINNVGYHSGTGETVLISSGALVRCDLLVNKDSGGKLELAIDNPGGTVYYIAVEALTAGTVKTSSPTTLALT